MNRSENLKPSAEPVAIVGIGCRFPGGADSPAALWNLLLNGEDAVVEVPKDRWDWRRFYHPDPAAPGKTYVREGAFLQEELKAFDARFFSISPREAAGLDPQQRLLLEVTWEAFEDAGIPLEKAAGTDVGVYAGGFTLDNKVFRMGSLNLPLADAHSGTSSTMALLSNRISHVFDFRGPSLTIDTACSSSLTALHYACQDLQQGTCSVAVACGVNVMLRPEYPVFMCKGHFLAPDGRCKMFDAQADGYGRGEGAGALILKPLSKAMEDGDQPYALIRATGINQDGHTPGISVPNVVSQEALIRKVHREANVRPEQITYVEAHGTGTQAGDLAEATALGHVLGQAGSGERKLLVGSVKTNIGHLEAAAGVAGVIKTALVLKTHQVPPNLHFKTPNPAIPLDELHLSVPTATEAIPVTDRPAFACVNSFGYGGTNAHAVLSEAPFSVDHNSKPVTELDGPRLFPVSARSPEALRHRAGDFANFLSQGDRAPADLLEDLCWSMTRRSSHHDHRLGVIAASKRELNEKLKSAATGAGDEGLVSGRVPTTRATGPVFVYTGMGPQWWGMGRELLRNSPEFRQSLEECDAIFSGLSGWSILEAMKADQSHSRMNEPEVSQPANFVLQVGLTAVWKSLAIEPVAVVGHSIGEVAAAWASGGLDLESAMTVCFHRSRLQQAFQGRGRMLAVGLSEAQARQMIVGLNDLVSIAAVNSMSSVVFSGDPIAIEELGRILEADGIFQKLLPVRVAYHSQQMEGLREAALRSLESIRSLPPQIPLYSTVEGSQLFDACQDADYWWRNLRNPVRFFDATESIIQSGHSIFVEIGPHPVLRGYLQEAMSNHKVEGAVAASLRRGCDERATILEGMAALWAAGHPVDWDRLSPIKGRFIRLPRYPWQRKPHFVETEASRFERLGPSGPPILGYRSPAPGCCWKIPLSTPMFPFLKDHRIAESVVFPGAASVEMVLAMDRELFGERETVIESMRFPHAMILDECEETTLHLRYDPAPGRFEIQGGSGDGTSEWTLHADGYLLEKPLGAEEVRLPLEEIRNRCSKFVEPGEIYGQLARRGLQYGESFRGIRTLHQGQGEVLAEIQASESLLDTDFSAYRVHPALLDACFQSLIATVDPSSILEDAVFVPVEIERVHLRDSPGESFVCYGRITEQNEGVIRGDLTLCDRSGRVLASIRGLCCRSLPSAEVDSENMANGFYAFEWESVDEPPGESTLAGDWLVFSRSRTLFDKVGDYLAARGGRFAKGSLNSMESGISENLRGVVFSGGEEPEDVTGVKACTGLLRLAKTLARVDLPADFQLFVVTTGAHVVDGEEERIHVGGASLWGLGRVIMNELPELGCSLFDLDPLASDPDDETLSKLFREGGKNEEQAIRDGTLFRPSLMPFSISQAGEESEKPVDRSVEAFVLESGQSGSLDSLRYREIRRRNPGPGEIEIEVHFGGVNFKDILKVMGKLSGRILSKTFYGSSLGLESSGIVVRIGSGVTAFKPGDFVVAAIREGLFRSHATFRLDEAVVIPKPEALSMAEAPLLIPYLTVYHGLRDLSGLREGERVLIHSATGGVGLAAIQYARKVNAEVFATAGSPEKRKYLRSMGIENVADSRTLEFADKVMEWTNGKGVDVVLNSLTREALLKSFELLAPYGRFVEIGKRDIDENQGLRMAAFNRNLSFFAIDVDRMLAERRDRIHELLDDIGADLEAGLIQPIPTVSFSSEKAVEAFQHMARARHIGKIAIDFRETPSLIYREHHERPLINPNASYLVSGGLSGFGLETAKWLVTKGARSLILVGRSGAVSGEATKAIREMEGLGATVRVEQADVSQRESVGSLMKRLKKKPPLRGVVHSAAVLKDGLLRDLEAHQFDAVMASKATGAWHLHDLTRDLDLDFFVLYSSVASLVGNSGQGNYAAANSFLDGLAHYRRKLGLPALSVNWGVLAEVGMAARDNQVSKHLDRIGIKGLPVHRALAALERLLAAEMVQAAFVSVDWDRWAKAHPHLQEASRFKRVVAQVRHGDGRIDDLRQRMAEIEPEMREEVMASMVSEPVAQVLRTSANLDIDQPLNQMGFDSLMMVEIQTALSSTFGISLSTIEMMKAGSIRALASLTLDRAGIEGALTTSETADGRAKIQEDREPAELRDRIAYKLEIRGNQATLTS